MKRNLSYDDPEHARRMAAQRARIESEIVEAEQIEREQAKAERAEKKKARVFRAKKAEKRVAVPWSGHWVRRIDRVNAMAANRGYST